MSGQRRGAGSRAGAVRVCAAIVAGVALAGVAAESGSGAGRPPPAARVLRPVASVQEIMLSEVNPSATYLWNAVSTESTAQGVVDHRPTSEADWLAARHQALVLIEAGNLLLMEGRPIVARGGQVEDAEQPGILGPAEIRQAMDADRARLRRLVHALQDATLKALAAIERKDADALLDAGGDIDEACEACHKTYWYPGSAPAGIAGGPAK